MCLAVVIKIYIFVSNTPLQSTNTKDCPEFRFLHVFNIHIAMYTHPMKPAFRSMNLCLQVAASPSSLLVHC